MRLRAIQFWFSIKNYNANKDYYKILAISQTANQNEIKKAFRLLAKKYHPDTNKGKEELFKEVNQAYQVLSSQKDKQQYDQVRASSSESHGSDSGNSTYHQARYGQQHSQNNHQHNQQYKNFYQSEKNHQEQNFYRGYHKETGWQNMSYRDQVLYEIYKKTQQEQNRTNRYQEQTNHLHPNHFSNQAQDYIRKYNQEIKARQEAIRKMHAEEEERKERQYKEYQQEMANDAAEKLKEKISAMTEGIAANVKGVLKMGEYLKSLWEKGKKKD